MRSLVPLLYSLLGFFPCSVFAAPPDDAKGFDGHHYKIVIAPGISWEEAATRANSEGGNLVSIESDFELEFIKSLGLLHGKFYWVGLYDRG